MLSNDYHAYFDLPDREPQEDALFSFLCQLDQDDLPEADLRGPGIDRL